MSSLQLGDQYPFDGSDDFWNGREDATPPQDWAHRAVRGVIEDLKGRRSIKRGFENIDEDIRIEIVATLSKIIRQAYAERVIEINAGYANTSTTD